MGAMNLRLLALLLSLALPVFAQDDELPPDEVADLVDRYVERGYESLREGNYEEARLRFLKALKREPANKQARLGVVTTHMRIGAYDKAEAELNTLLQHHAGDRDALVRFAALDMRRGRLSAVRARAREVIEKSPGEGPDLAGLEARALLAEALARNGKRDEARTTLDFFLDYYEARLPDYARARADVETIRFKPAQARPLAIEMTLVARALRNYVQLSPLDNDFAQNAYDLLNVVKDLDPDYWEGYIERVRVTRIDRESSIAKAHKIEKIVTRRNPELADLYVEVAKSVLGGWNQSEARDLAETALKINPKQTDARAIIARALLEDNQYADATEQMDAGLAVDPNHRALLSLKATLALLIGNKDEFEAGMKRVLAVDPTYGEGFHLAGLVVASRQRRYDIAADLVRRGLVLDPLNFDAHTTLGVFLANQGRAKEAIESLEKSKKLIPYSHPIRNNFIKVLDYVTRTMTEIRTRDFVMRFDPGEFPILSRFLPDLLESCWDDMVKRYDFTPRKPVLVETFRHADDFSVRTLGLPGIPALGACFGGLITLDSPQALKPGAFLWASTARHEFAHVISLQLSHGQVPRWFTEGLSVLEEKPLDTGWGMDENFERQVYDAYATGTLPKVRTFDAMFRSSRVAYAYYVGGLMLEFLQENSGEAGIVKALRLFGEDRSLPTVFEKAFGLKLDDFDDKFSEFIGKRVAHYRLVPNYGLVATDLRKRVLKNPKDGEALIRLAWAYYYRRKYVDAAAFHDRARKVLGNDNKLVLLLQAHLTRRADRPDEARALYEKFFAAGGEDFEARMIMASYFAREGEPSEEKFVDALQKAKAAWPVQAHGNSPYALLRRHYMTKGLADLALKELEAQARILSKGIRLRLQLAREYLDRQRPDDAIHVLEEALRITLFDPNIHRPLVELYRGVGKTKKAIRSARCVVALLNEKSTEVEVASSWLDLAEVLLDDGQTEEAKGALERAAEQDAPAVAGRLEAVKKRLGQ